MAALQLDFGKGVTKDRPCALRLFRKACDLGEEPVGCFNFGLALLQGKLIAADPGRGVGQSRRACRAGTAQVCVNAALTIDKGKLPNLGAAEANQLWEASSRVLVPSARSGH